MRAVELFAGVGGFRLGLERNNISVIWANEWDKYAADVYDKNFGGKINRESITDVRAEDIPPHDLICGGFPCQAFSIAGKRKGFDETRGTLFFDIMRIARHHRTPYLFLENVKGLLNHDGGATFHTILRSLDELGYDCQWQVLNSKNFGVPQNRERVFIIGHLRGQSRPEVFPIGESDEVHFEAGEAEEGLLAGTLTARQFANWGGNFVNEIEKVGKVNEGQRGRVYSPSGVSPTISTPTGGGSSPAIVTHYGHKNKPADFHKISPTLKAQSHGHEPMVGLQGQIRRLTPVECERLQGFPDGWTEGVSDSQRYKMMGNAVTVNVIEAIAERLIAS